MASPTLELLPTEILQSIVCFASPDDAVALGRTSHRLVQIAYEEQIWRSFCLRTYHFWDVKWVPALSGKEAIGWRKAFAERKQIDRLVNYCLKHILDSQSGRIDLFQKISDCGYDAKDVLVAETKIAPTADDYLSRRYWSKAVLDHLHRKMALNQWHDLGFNSHPVDEDRLERCIAAFDMFLIDEAGEDLGGNLRQLNGLVHSLLEEQPEIMAASPKARALSAASFLRARSMIGITSDRHYHDIEHNFLGLALSRDQHNSLPLISVLIYCFVANKLGLRARLCNYPFHVIAVMLPPHGLDFEGSTISADLEIAPMYLDPWQSEEEVSVDKLRSQLIRLREVDPPYEPYLQPCGDSEVVLRSAKNILNSLQEARDNPSVAVDQTKAQYAALWAWLLVMSSPQRGGGIAEHLHNGFPAIIDACISIFPHDASLLKKYLFPYTGHRRDHLHYTANVESLCQEDRQPKVPKRRAGRALGKLKYRIGQVFEHRRYGYKAVIVGWDPECAQHEQWIQMMQVDRLPGGRDQCFYNVLVNDDSMRYVAEENIKIIEPEQFEYPPVFPFEAGKYFKRWDKDLHRFISNIHDEYPDD